MTIKPPFDRSAAMKAQWDAQRAFFAQHTPVTPLLEPVAALKQRQPRVISLESLAVSPAETTQELFQRLQRDEVAEMSLRQAGCEDDLMDAVLDACESPRVRDAIDSTHSLGKYAVKPPKQSLLRTVWERMFRPSGTKPTTTKKTNPWILKEDTK